MAGTREGDTAVDGVWFRTGEPPSQVLQSLARDLGLSVQDPGLAAYLDSLDPLRPLRLDFCYPRNKDMHGTDLGLVSGEEECVYLAGFGLGLLPRHAPALVQRELDKWSRLGQHGFRQGEMPWTYCDEVIDEGIADLIGAKKGEVCLMNGCSVNLHLMLVSFYRPTPQRHKIVCEAQAFPSDYYVFESQIRFHGFDPSTSLVCLEPRKGESTLRTEDVVSWLAGEGEGVALVCLPGLHFLTGQAFNMAAITKAAQDKGCYVGWDLSHSIGNLEHHLHAWGVDFAVWCANKYLCSGAGGIGGIFLHEKHHSNDFPKLLGWMGHDLSTRFIMDNKMDPCPGAYAYRVCSPSPLLCAVTQAYLQVMRKTSLAELRRKTRLLTGYLELLINLRYAPGVRDDVTITVITPRDPEERGAMLSLRVSVDSQRLLQELLRRGAECDRREPDIIRVAPVPLYCSFKDVHRFMELLEQALQAL